MVVSIGAPRVFVIDDDARVRAAIAGLLKSEGLALPDPEYRAGVPAESGR
jgi:FixJ family two-component response regulator